MSPGAVALTRSPLCRTSSECSSEDEEARSRLIERIAHNDSEGYSTVEAPRAEGAPFSLPAHLYPDELLDDLTISPYASFTSLCEPRPTMLSGWLDKLSPQGYVGQSQQFGAGGTCRSSPSTSCHGLGHLLLSRAAPSPKVWSAAPWAAVLTVLPWPEEALGAPEGLPGSLCSRAWDEQGSARGNPPLPNRFSAIPTGTMSSRGATSVSMGRT